MPGVLLLMAEHFNDWDLQAVVRSCGSVAHPEPAAAAAPRAEADAEPPTTTPPAAPRGDEPAPAARATPPPPPVAKASAALLYDLEYLGLDHKPFLLPVVAPSPRPRAGDDGRGEREVMISFPAGAASTSGMQQRASPPGRKSGARTPRPKRRYRTDAVRSNSIHHRV